MSNFAELTHAEQFAAIEHLARAALREYGVEPQAMETLVHAENTTYKVTSDQGFFCIRVCRPGYRTRSQLESELAFVSDLASAGFHVPAPFPPGLVQASAPEVPEARNCLLLHWQEGVIHREGLSVAQAASVGEVMGRLHNFAAAWSVPEGFDRPSNFDWISKPNGHFDAPNERIREEDRLLLLEVDQRTRGIVARLGRDPASFGLIHADLHHGNLLFDGDRLNLIDFDDVCWSYWLYDFAAALVYELPNAEYPAVRDAMLEGYARHRPLPPLTEELLNPFLQLRLAGVSNWILSRADNPRIRAASKGWIEHMCNSIRSVPIES